MTHHSGSLRGPSGPAPMRANHLKTSMDDAKITSESPEFVVAGPAAAAVLGLSVRQFGRLVKSGVLPRHGPRQFELGAVVKAYIGYLEAGHEGSTSLADARLMTERARGAGWS